MWEQTNSFRKKFWKAIIKKRQDSIHEGLNKVNHNDIYNHDDLHYLCINHDIKPKILVPITLQKVDAYLITTY